MYNIYIYTYIQCIYIYHTLYIYIYIYTIDIYIYIMSWVAHELPQSHCCDNRGAHCFHDKIYIILIFLLWDLSTPCVVDHLWPLIYITYILCHLYILKNNCIFRKKMSFGQFYILWHWIQTLVFTLLH